MSDFEIRGEQPESEPEPATPVRPHDDPPARRLLAHDLEPLAWDDDGDGVLPPPD